jgi:hypothetical protein
MFSSVGQSLLFLPTLYSVSINLWSQDKVNETIFINCSLIYTYIQFFITYICTTSYIKIVCSLIDVCELSFRKTWCSHWLFYYYVCSLKLWSTTVYVVGHTVDNPVRFHYWQMNNLIENFNWICACAIYSSNVLGCMQEIRVLVFHFNT